MKNFPVIQTVSTLVHTKDDTAAVTIKASHCYYIVTFPKTSKAKYKIYNYKSKHNKNCCIMLYNIFHNIIQ